MKSTTWFLGAALFLATSCLVDFTHAAGDCLCGITPTKTPCGLCGNDPDVLVRAAVPPKPQFFASPKAISEASSLKLPPLPLLPAPCAAPPTIFDLEDQTVTALGGLNPSAIMALGPNEQIVPKFLPLGDLCNPNAPSHPSPVPTATVIPAIAPKPICQCANRQSGLAQAFVNEGVIPSPNAGLIGLDGPLIAGSGCAGAPAAGALPAALPGLFGLPGLGGYPSLPSYPGLAGYSNTATQALADSLGLSGSGAQLLGNLLGPRPGGFTSLNQATAQNELLNSFQEEDELTFDEQERVYNGQTLPAVPADPVSISIAYKQLLQPLITQKKKTVQHGSEGKLSFGPLIPPKDGRKTATVPDIPEEKLINIDKPVVELKLKPAAAGGCALAPKDEDDELLDQLQALERERLEREQEKALADKSGSGSCSYISFSDLGYGPVAPTKNNFITQTATAPLALSALLLDSIDETPCGPLGPPVPGYRPGSVIFKAPKPCGNADLGLLSRALPAEVQDASIEEDDEETQSGELLSRFRPRPPVEIIGGGCRRCGQSCNCNR